MRSTPVAGAMLPYPRQFSTLPETGDGQSVASGRVILAEAGARNLIASGAQPA